MSNSEPKRPKCIPKDALKKSTPLPTGNARSVTAPTEAELEAAERTLEGISVTRHNYATMTQAVQNHFGFVMKNGGQQEALAVMNAADVFRRYVSCNANVTAMAKTAPASSGRPPCSQEESVITQSGCWKLNDQVRIGEKGVLGMTTPPSDPRITVDNAVSPPSSGGADLQRISSGNTPLLRSMGNCSSLCHNGSSTSSPSSTFSPKEDNLESSRRLGSESPVDSHTSVTPGAGTTIKSMRLDELEDVRLLGAGSQGKVWLKRWRGNQELYAVKEMTISLEMDKKQQQHVTQELKSLIHAPSEYIVPIYQAYLKQNNLTIVQQYMDVGSLEDLLKSHKVLPEVCIAAIALQLFRALQEMALVRKQLHRDIKPANILLSRRGEVKLADFGVASNVKTIGESSFIGTTTYMSPERIKGQRYSLPSDIWAVGLVCCECLLGRYPFAYTNFMDLLDKVTSDTKLILPDSTPSDMVTVMWGCLAQLPDERITCDGALNSPWLQRHQASSCLRAFQSWIAENVST